MENFRCGEEWVRTCLFVGFVEWVEGFGVRLGYLLLFGRELGKVVVSVVYVFKSLVFVSFSKNLLSYELFKDKDVF